MIEEPQLRLDRLSVLVATHVYATGPAHALVDYLQSRVACLTVVQHPFSFAPETASVVRRYERGSLTFQRSLPWPRRLPEPLTWTKDAVLTLWWGLRVSGRIDLIVAADGLLAATALLIRRVGKARRVVLWTIDYSPKRFRSRLLNAVYHSLDRVCVRRCDETWNLSTRMEAARAQRGVHGPQRHVPLGVWALAPRGSQSGTEIVFLGHLLEKQGLQMVLEALPAVRLRVPSTRLVVLGDGPYREALEQRAEELGVRSSVEFTGFITDHREVERRLSHAAVAVATYDPDRAGFSAYADSGKVKAYLAAGLPVVLTRVAELAPEIERSGAGRLVEYEPDAVADALIEYLEAPDNRRRAGHRARMIASQFLWERILNDAFRGLLAGAGACVPDQDLRAGPGASCSPDSIEGSELEHRAGALRSGS